MHMTFAKFKEYTKAVYPYVTLVVLATPTLEDDKTIDAMEQIALASGPEGVDWTKVREAAKGLVIIMELIAQRTPPKWDDDLVVIIKTIMGSDRPPVFAAE